MSIEDKIWILAHSSSPEDRREWAVLYWKAQGLKHEEIADKWGYSINWVQRYMTSAYKRFEVPPELNKYEKLKELEDKVFPLIRKFIEDDPEVVRELPPPPTGSAPVEDAEYTGNSSVIPRPIETIIIKNNPPKEDKWKLFKRVFFAILSLLIFLTVGYFAYNLGRGATPAPQIVVITTTPVPATETPLPTETSVIPTDTPVPTLTATQVPTNTPVPTEFVPPADGILFQDNFDGGASELWNPDISNGTWRVINGKYSYFSDDNFSWFYNYTGDLNWRNYVVELDYSFENDTNGSLAVLIRSGANGRKTLAFIIESNGGHWAVYNDGKWSDIGEETTDYFDVGHARVEVQGDTFTGVSSGGNGIVVTDPTVSETGRIGIGVRCRFYAACPLIDNIKINYLP